VKILPKISFLISAIISLIFVIYFGYKGFMIYFIQSAIDDTFIGGNTSDITVTLWFALTGTMTLSMFLFFQFMKVKDLKSQRTMLQGAFFGWASICATLIIILPGYIYFVILTGIASIITLLSSIRLKKEIIEELNKKSTLSEKEIYLLQKLAGINPKK